jgi:hypothetical protein
MPETVERPVLGLMLPMEPPYEEGHTLTENEAAALNQTYMENLGNNYRGKIQKALDDAKVESIDGLPADVRDKLVSDFIEYQNGYEIGVRGTRESDPVRAQALQIAKEKVREALKRKGFTLKGVGKDQINSLAEQALQRNPQIMETARGIVEARKVADEKISIDVSNVA